MNTEAPLEKPKKTMVRNHVHFPAMPTAASGVSPSLPIIMVSISVKEEASRFCSVTGTAMESSVRVKPGGAFVMALRPREHLENRAVLGDERAVLHEEEHARDRRFEYLAPHLFLHIHKPADIPEKI